MRFLSVLKGDIRFQFRYGFYFIYALFTLLYVLILQLVGDQWQARVAVLMIYSDPAVLGLFFMGAILQFEKDEHTLHSLVVSPLKPGGEYVLSKLCSLSIIATLVALSIAGFGTVVAHPVLVGGTIFIGSCLFSSLGLVLATKTDTLNQFIFATIPCLLVISIPAAFYILRPGSPPWMLLHPGISIIELCLSGEYRALAGVSLLLWTSGVLYYTVQTTKAFFNTLGGGVKR